MRGGFLMLWKQSLVRLMARQFAAAAAVPHNERLVALGIWNCELMCSRRFTRRVFLVFALAAASVVLGLRAPAQIPGEEANGGPRPSRPYGDGPLTEADFRGKTPTEGKLANSPFQAFLFLDIHWSCQYRTVGRGRVFTALLTQFEATAVCNPVRSWNHWGKGNPDLLDHEQGHFDITQIHAQRLELRLRKLVAAKKPPSASGETEALAIEALNSLLDKESKAAKSVSDEENVEYDKLTKHGTGLEKQRELRRVHQETLRKLAEELKAARKKN